ncbi:MAG: hypothetical protein ACRDYZ_01205, partial [Acidimicrobiales bacterium]
SCIRSNPSTRTSIGPIIAASRSRTRSSARASALLLPSASGSTLRSRRAGSSSCKLRVPGDWGETAAGCDLGHREAGDFGADVDAFLD